MTLNAEEQPLNVQALNGEVVMTGPRVAIALCPQAATETARRLIEAAGAAACQAQSGETSGPDDIASNDIL